MQMRAERENFRRKLVELIARDDAEADDDAAAMFPNKNEIEMLRYYYYIKHGIDTIHVAPISNRVMSRIKLLIPPILNKWAIAMTENLDEIKTDYIFAMKKAVIDFVLNDSIENLKSEKKVALSHERIEVNQMFNRWKYR